MVTTRSASTGLGTAKKASKPLSGSKPSKTPQPKPPPASSGNASTNLSSSTVHFPPKTPDGHFIIVNNRKWRATDPLIPPDEFAKLKHFLGKGRSGVRRKAEEGDAVRVLARRRTALAKLGLGERGKPEWWNDTEEGRRKRWEGALRELRELGE